MAKLIIYLTGKPNITGFKRGPFTWSPAHAAYLFQAKEFTEQEFNKIAEKTLRDFDHEHPLVRVSTFSPTMPAPVPAAAPGAQSEMTVDEAVELLKREAPELLKKKTGPKPQVLAEV
jgi:hypothetical protein